MSHYAVAVFHRADQDVDELLAPFDENIEVEPYVAYTRQEAIDYARKHFDGYRDKSDDECYKAMASDRKTDKDGNILTTYNPNSKWDWYVVGGRFAGMLNKKGEAHIVGYDSARVGDIDFSLDNEKYFSALRWWEVVVDEEPLRDDEDEDDFWTIYNKNYFLERYKDKYDYATQTASFSTWSVLTPDGEWHEPGQMGWFGVSLSEPEDEVEFFKTYAERYIDAADPDWYLTIVDCHI